MFCAQDSGIARGQTLRVATKKSMAWSCFSVKSSVFGQRMPHFAVILWEMEVTNVGALKFQWHKVKASYRVPVEDSVTEQDYGSLRIPYHNYCGLKNLINVTHLDEIKLKISRLIHANWVGSFVSNAEFVRKVVAGMPSLGLVGDLEIFGKKTRKW